VAQAEVTTALCRKRSSGREMLYEKESYLLEQEKTKNKQKAHKNQSKTQVWEIGGRIQLTLNSSHFPTFSSEDFLLFLLVYLHRGDSDSDVCSLATLMPFTQPLSLNLS
jgi:predicted metal-dependent hydrolase